MRETEGGKDNPTVNTFCIPLPFPTSILEDASVCFPPPPSPLPFSPLSRCFYCLCHCSCQSVCPRVSRVPDQKGVSRLCNMLEIYHSGPEPLCLYVYLSARQLVCLSACLAPMGSPSRGGGVSRLSLHTPFSPIFVCPSAYRNLSPVLLFTHQLLPTYLQFSSSGCPFCLHRPFTYISLLYKSSFCHFSFSLWSTRDPAR